MRIGLLGTGIVGNTLATKLASLGHDVKMGSRTAGNERAAVNCGTFEDAAKHGEVIINATSGEGSLAALDLAGAANLAGKTLIDVSNPLTFESGGPALAVGNTDSLGEQIQQRFPDAQVVKTLNTMNCALMVEPTQLPGTHNVFVNGNNEGAKLQTKALLQEFGWPADSIIDLGDITASRGTEGAILLWIKLMQANGNANFNIHIVRP